MFCSEEYYSWVQYHNHHLFPISSSCHIRRSNTSLNTPYKYIVTNSLFHGEGEKHFTNIIYTYPVVQFLPDMVVVLMQWSLLRSSPNSWLCRYTSSILLWVTWTCVLAALLSLLPSWLGHLQEDPGCWGEVPPERWHLSPRLGGGRRQPCVPWDHTSHYSNRRGLD